MHVHSLNFILLFLSVLTRAQVFFAEGFGLKCCGVEPKVIPENQIARICEKQVNACASVCQYYVNGPVNWKEPNFPMVNSCDTETFEYSCMCKGRREPDMSRFLDTIPGMWCHFWAAACEDHAKDNETQAEFCAKEKEQCPTRDSIAAELSLTLAQPTTSIAFAYLASATNGLDRMMRSYFSDQGQTTTTSSISSSTSTSTTGATTTSTETTPIEITISSASESPRAERKDGELSTGAKAGIGIGALSAVVLTTALAFWWFENRRRKGKLIATRDTPTPVESVFHGGLEVAYTHDPNLYRRSELYGSPPSMGTSKYSPGRPKPYWPDSHQQEDVVAELEAPNGHLGVGQEQQPEVLCEIATQSPVDNVATSGLRPDAPREARRSALPTSEVITTETTTEGSRRTSRRSTLPVLPPIDRVSSPR